MAIYACQTRGKHHKGDTAMRISKLSELAGLPVGTVKFYLRTGLLHPGRATSALTTTQSVPAMNTSGTNGYPGVR